MLLKGIKVLDCGSYVAGPAAATVMADFGADVIKIEPPGGDPYRGLLARRPDGVIDFFWDMDARNKRSLCLDIKKPKGREILDALIGETDVFLTNFRPQLLDRLQLGFEHVKAMNEKVIYAQVNSFGLSGADRNRTGFDITAWWARSGLADFVRRPSSLVAHSAPGMGDHATSMSLFGGIMAALYRREKDGLGSHVHTSLLANGVWAHSMMVQGGLAGFDRSQQRSDEDMYRNPMGGIYRTRDERLVLLNILNPDKEWNNFATAIGRENWLTDPRFDDSAERRKNAVALSDELIDTFASNDGDHWQRQLDRFEITYNLVARMEDLLVDPQVFDNDILTPVSDETLPYTHTVNSPVWLSDVKKVPHRQAPDIGQHSREILASIGIDDAEIDVLLVEDVVRST